jgi:hypothetical protein
MPFSAIKACLLNLALEADGFTITKEQLVSLAELVPTPAELQLVTSYVGDVAELGDVRCRTHGGGGGGQRARAGGRGADTRVLRGASVLMP